MSISNQKAKVFIVDDHPIVREGLTELINNKLDLQVCGQAENGMEALKKIDQLKPDMVIVDISLKGFDGIELIKNIRIRFPQLPALVLSMHDEALYAERSLRAGAKGYIMKHEGTSNLIEAIRKILNGEIYLSKNMNSLILNKAFNNDFQNKGNAVDSLSDRELTIFNLIGQGMKNMDIAKLLNLSVKTIEVHREHIKKKLNLKTANELVIYASQNLLNDIKAE